MAGDWIKMRVWLGRDPKVIRMADFISCDRSFMNWLTDPVRQSCKESAYEHVTRNVIVALCVTGLLVTWGTAREQGDRIGDDLVLSHCDFSTLDAMTDLPGFGDAMGAVGWAEEREDGSLVFPKFFKDNESPDDRHRRQNAERQARYREKHAEKPVEKGNEEVTPLRNVTVTTEKRREEKSKTYRVAEHPLPDWLPADAWIAFCEMRRLMKKPINTSRAANGVIGDIDRLRKAGYSPLELLDEATKRNWLTVYEPKQGAKPAVASQFAGAV